MNRFTWYDQGGCKLSKLCRFLISRELLDTWPALSALALDRIFSDHCPILLKSYTADFGPIPFKFFNHWMQEEGFNELISKEWVSSFIKGSSSFILKEKLKHLKSSIRAWRNSNLSSDSVKDFKLRTEVTSWNMLASKRELMTNSETEDFIATRRNYFLAKKCVTQSIRKKSRICWAVDGDENSRYFHRSVRRRMKQNSLKGLKVNGR